MRALLLALLVPSLVLRIGQVVQTCPTSFKPRALHVLGVSHDLQVGGVHAETADASARLDVVDLHAFRYGSDPRFIGEAVRVHLAVGLAGTGLK